MGWVRDSITSDIYTFHNQYIERKIMAEAVKVMVRVRPMNQKQIDRKCLSIVQTNEKLNQITLKTDEPDNPKNFSYDNIFGINVAQSYIYEQTAFNLVESVVEGYNGTIFAYGQTGCGKTFTMMGVPDHPELKGIIPRTFQHIIDIIQSTKQKKFLVRCSFLEIYNEEVHDLLSKDIKEKKQVKESPDKGIYVKDLSMLIVKTLEEMDKYLNLGFKNRAVGATQMNKDSSRSHSIFTLYLQTQEQGPVDIRYVGGKLNLVDLAGSERQSKTKAEGDRLKQATKINLSLSALGNVISALVDGKSKHVPYRDSKLTRLLQDSLGGNTKTIMIANCSPADYNYQQTLSTLRYASRAKFIKNKPIVNQDPKDALLKEYADEIKRLKMMLQNGGMPNGNGGGTTIVYQNGEPQIRTIQVVKTVEVGRQFQDKLKDKQNELKKNMEQKQLILQKLKSLEQQVVQGGTKQNTVQAKKYKDLKLKIKKTKAQQEKLLEQATKAQQQLVQVTSSFKNVQQQNAIIRQKLLMLQAKYKEAKKEIKDLEEQHAYEKYELMENIRWCEKDIKFYYGICKRIITQDQIDIIKSNSEWNDEINDYHIVPFLLKQKKVTFPKLSERQVEDMGREEMNARQMITYEDENRKKNRSNWDQEYSLDKYKAQKISVTAKIPKKPLKQIRESRQYLNNNYKEQLMQNLKQPQQKSNKNIILAPLQQINLQSSKISRTLEQNKPPMQRNKLLQPLK